MPAIQLMLVVIEKTEAGYSAYSPNLTGVTVSPASARRAAALTR